MDLITEEAKPPRPSRAHRSFADHSTRSAAVVADRGHLDDISSVWNNNFEGRVIEVAASPSSDECRYRLEHLAVERDRMSALPERDPIQVDAGCLVRGLNLDGHGCFSMPMSRRAVNLVVKMSLCAWPRITGARSTATPLRVPWDNHGRSPSPTPVPYVTSGALGGRAMAMGD
jgi:hypothetical protein